jgi:hypothetical protein
MQAIITISHGATNHKPARISVNGSGNKKRIYISRGDLEIDGNDTDDDLHTRAAKRYCRLMNWPGLIVGGRISIDKYAFFFYDSLIGY